MECNKEEALRAKRIAEKKLAENDFMAAKRFASKAQQMYPELDGIAELLEQIEAYVASPAASSRNVPGTFWTECDHCKKQYELFKISRHHNSICQNCRTEFFAREVAPPSTNGGSQSVTSVISSQQQQNPAHQTENDVGRMHEADVRSNAASGATSAKRRFMDDVGGYGKDEGKGNAKRKWFGKTNVLRDQNKFAKHSPLHWRSFGATSDAESSRTMSRAVRDHGFYDLNKDRKEESFGEYQVWAVYDEVDKMPRSYVQIHCVVDALTPFTVWMSWLNSQNNSQLGPRNYVSFGLPRGCGEFVAGRCEIKDLQNSFSHKVEWTEGERGSVCIYPKKGEVWALYTNWSTNWDELTLDEVMYGIVEVVDTCDREGVSVTPLVKVPGFKAVFGRNLEIILRRIHRDEMFRFSHRVPSYLLTGKEAPNAPRGCWELDPAAIPSQLLDS